MNLVYAVYMCEPMVKGEYPLDRYPSAMDKGALVVITSYRHY